MQPDTHISPTHLHFALISALKLYKHIRNSTDKGVLHLKRLKLRYVLAVTFHSEISQQSDFSGVIYLVLGVTGFQRTKILECRSKESANRI